MLNARLRLVSATNSAIKPFEGAIGRIEMRDGRETFVLSDGSGFSFSPKKKNAFNGCIVVETRNSVYVFEQVR